MFGKEAIQNHVIPGQESGGAAGCRRINCINNEEVTVSIGMRDTVLRDDASSPDLDSNGEVDLISLNLSKVNVLFYVCSGQS